MRAPLPRWLPLAVFAVFAAGLLGAGALLQRSMRAAARERALAELGAVAALKVAAVAEWRDDAVRNAEYAGSYPTVLGLAATRRPGDQHARAHVASVLGHYAARFGYAEAALVDVGGAVLAEGVPGRSIEPPAALVQRAISTGRPASDLALDGGPRLDVAAPVPSGPGARAVLFVRVPAAEIVASTLSAWPSSTATATAAIVPAAGRPPPAGEAVLATVRPIPDSGFGVETTMAIGAVEAPLLRPAAAIAALVLALLVASGAALLEWWRRESERRRLEAQLATSERMAALGTLAAGVAHEINNPLAYLIANLDFASEGLRAGSDPPALRDALGEAREGAERVRRTVQALRTFARPGSGSRAPVDVAAELDAAVRMARNEVRHRARLDVRIGPMPPVVAADRDLGQVFLNLLVNAAQAIPEGDAARHLVEVVADTEARGRARIEIRDSGAGIPPEVLPRLFTPFFTTKPQGVGVGLGLAICHGIVEAAGGTIQVESQVGSGSTFRVLLPPAGPAGAPAAPERRIEAPGTAASAARPAGRVLVVDDDPLVGRAMARSLQSTHDVVAATSAAEALDRIRGGERFDALVCDLMMPEMTGMDLYERLCEVQPELARRIVFATGGAFTERSRDFLRRVPNARIEKPFDPARLREVVARAISA